MRLLTALFFSRKYWPVEDEIVQAIEIIKENTDTQDVAVIINGDFSAVPQKDYDALVAVPMSGSVQPDIIHAAKEFKHIALYAAYVQGSLPLEWTNRILCANAAPTVMDVYGVLKRDLEKTVLLLNGHKAFLQYQRACRAYERVKNGRLLMIGEPEPWVISISRNYEDYERNLGVSIVSAEQNELIELYHATNFEEAEAVYQFFRNGAMRIFEPTNEDMIRCARMAWALERLLRRYSADGAAISCFNLIGQTGVNPCIGVSHINSATDRFVACEGDIDSAITMLMMKELTDEKPWMANPILMEDDTITFSHCTAPFLVHGENQAFTLRNHHETGIGVSPCVSYRPGLQMTLLRYSGISNALTVNTGESLPTELLPTCRTQLRIRLADYHRFISNVIGCHQVMTFQNIEKEARLLSELLHVKNI